MFPAMRAVAPLRAINRSVGDSVADAPGIEYDYRLRIPMMAISRSEVMAISAERSDARLFQFGSVIGMRQGV
jgi:hypothetical protein